jgi:Tfp pilus assembly protein PilN
MTIEIEAGASQSQFSMKPLAVHAFFVGQPGTAGYPRLMQIWRSMDRSRRNQFVSKETPSLSLRLRSVQAVQRLANAARKKSNTIRVRSNCVRFSFERI